MTGNIILIVPNMHLFVTGDLTLYADALGKPSTSSYW
jgi:hypothetical protein